MLAVIAMTVVCQAQEFTPPNTCKVGDAIIGYEGFAYCRSENKWDMSESPTQRKPITELKWTTVYGDYTGPTCRFAFLDTNKEWHCPFETASGRIVAVFPCNDKKLYNKISQWNQVPSCHAHYKEYLRLIQVMKTHETVEPTAVEVTMRYRYQLDHARIANQNEYLCPDGFAAEWFTPKESRNHDAPLCVRPKLEINNVENIK